MSIKTFKPLPIGNEDFASLREKGCYYVDKTPYLKVVFEHPAPVMLFTRPRRFGKTLLMDMFATYLAIDEDGSTGRERKEKLFAGLEVSEDATFADKYMGQFPVIFISLKKVYGDDFKHAYDMLVMMVSKLYSGYQFLKASPRLTELEKKRLFKYEDPDYLCTDEAEKYLVEGLDFLSKCLHKHYEKKVILLIDEYDVPLAKASEKGYHSQMVDLISHFFDIIKKNPNNNKEYGIEKIVLTGCLKVAKNSIF
ncbi:MAG: AAA family ATPase, partial [Succinivibrionaceae bacterium]